MTAYQVLVTVGIALGVVALVGYAVGMVVVWRKGSE